MAIERPNPESSQLNVSLHSWCSIDNGLLAREGHSCVGHLNMPSVYLMLMSFQASLDMVVSLIESLPVASLQFRPQEI